MREEETDLSFAEFDSSKWLYPAPTPERDNSQSRNYAEELARREGFEPPTLRFEAGFGGFQETPEIKDFGHLAHIA